MFLFYILFSLFYFSFLGLLWHRNWYTEHFRRSKFFSWSCFLFYFFFMFNFSSLFSNTCFHTIANLVIKKQTPEKTEKVRIPPLGDSYFFSSNRGKRTRFHSVRAVMDASKYLPQTIIFVIKLLWSTKSPHPSPKDSNFF